MKVLRTENATRERLERLIQRLPRGGRVSLARLCGFADSKRLMAVARYNAYLTPAVARRLDGIMDHIDRGKLVLVDSGRVHAGTRLLVWQHYD